MTTTNIDGDVDWTQLEDFLASINTHLDNVDSDKEWTKVERRLSEMLFTELGVKLK